jgi:hypothetical protein
MSTELGTDTTEPWCFAADVAFQVGDALAIGPTAPDTAPFGLNNTGGDLVVFTATPAASSAVIAQAPIANGSPTNAALTRSPDLTGDFVTYANAAGAIEGEAASPGVKVGWEFFAAFNPE